MVSYKLTPDQLSVFELLSRRVCDSLTYAALHDGVNCINFSFPSPKVNLNGEYGIIVDSNLFRIETLLLLLLVKSLFGEGFDGVESDDKSPIMLVIPG